MPGLVGHLDVEGVAVGVGEDHYRHQPELAAGAQHNARRSRPVGDQHLLHAAASSQGWWTPRPGVADKRSPAATGAGNLASPCQGLAVAFWCNRNVVRRRSQRTPHTQTQWKEVEQHLERSPRDPGSVNTLQEFWTWHMEAARRQVDTTLFYSPEGRAAQGAPGGCGQAGLRDLQGTGAVRRLRDRHPGAVRHLGRPVRERPPRARPPQRPQGRPAPLPHGAGYLGDRRIRRSQSSGPSAGGRPAS